MASYKLWLTVLVLAGPIVDSDGLFAPSTQRRPRRANSDSPESPSNFPEIRGLRAGYRFGDEYFLPEATKSVPTERKAKANGCERVVKNSMVCMVCKDPETNEKYEQCSYVAKPNEKAFTYEKSSAFGKPAKRNKPTRESETSDSTESSVEAFASSESPTSNSQNYENPRSTESTYSHEDDSRGPARYTGASSEETGTTSGHSESLEEKDNYKPYDEKSSYESSEDPAESSDCRQVQKDDQTCSICKDPKTGRDLERCSSSYTPDDEVYAYGNSERYGYPYGDASNENSEFHHEDKSAESDGSYESSPSEFQAGYLKSNDNNYGRYRDEEIEEPSEFRETTHRSPDHHDREKLRSAEYAAPTVASERKKSADEETDCREVQKDSMTCTVCTDPKTGGNFQKCSYAYQPNDKVYKFSKSKTFGYPEILEGGKVDDNSAKSSGEPEAYRRGSESKRVPETVRANHCKQVRRGSKTCTVCEDPATGKNSEQCAYHSAPKEKLFTYSKSKSSGSPRSEKKTRGGGSETPGQESRQVPKWSENKDAIGSEKSADATESSHCKQVQRDSMTCTVCRDPKTGSHSERCAYSSVPKKKLFTYSKSKSYGGSKNKGTGSGDEKSEINGEPENRPWKNDGGDGKSEEVVEDAESRPCKRVIKNSMICTVCKDSKTGANSEQCSYSSEPKKKHFTYSNSKSYGNPGKQEDETAESRHVRRGSNYDEHHPRSQGHRDLDSDRRPRGFSKPEWDFNS